MLIKETQNTTKEILQYLIEEKIILRSRETNGRLLKVNYENSTLFGEYTCPSDEIPTADTFQPFKSLLRKDFLNN